MGPRARMVVGSTGRGSFNELQGVRPLLILLKK
jgi:hypothetical protein